METSNLDKTELKTCNGATPLSVADAVIRDCNDEEWLNDVIFYLRCYLLRTYEAPDQGLILDVDYKGGQKNDGKD